MLPISVQKVCHSDTYNIRNRKFALAQPNSRYKQTGATTHANINIRSNHAYRGTEV